MLTRYSVALATLHSVPALTKMKDSCQHLVDTSCDDSGGTDVAVDASLPSAGFKKCLATYFSCAYLSHPPPPQKVHVVQQQHPTVDGS
jgi:hypothetical protein